MRNSVVAIMVAIAFMFLASISSAAVNQVSRNKQVKMHKSISGNQGINPTPPQGREQTDPKQAIVTSGQSWCIRVRNKLPEWQARFQVMGRVTSQLKQGPARPMCQPRFPHRLTRQRSQLRNRSLHLPRRSIAA